MPLWFRNPGQEEKQLKIVHSLDHFPPQFQGGVLAIGKFDGLHRGHVRILKRLWEYARDHSVPPLVFTFDPLPGQILRPETAPPLLVTLEQKMELLADYGVECVIVYPTTREFLLCSARQFFESVIRRDLQAKVIIEGQNFLFGNNREGTPEMLGRFCRESGIVFETISPCQWNGLAVSSSAVRSFLSEGNISAANEMLTRPYQVTGTVVHGEHRGRTLGFPTANLEKIGTLLPRTGIYACLATLDSEHYPAAVHIGTNPTFGVTPFKMEVHLLDFSGLIYGKTLKVDFLERLRDTTAYPSREALIDRMNHDVEQTRMIANRPSA
ncbi:MAG: bifunctional riboflavin kinase/FAD synthetase [Planctomycetaceae bacterium]|nr:bifunctional riboflavin kinase/FAD synthetase [Planctomycetaceae bacterium]